MKLVLRSPPFQRTNEPLTKLDPFTVSVKAGAPATAEVGLRLETVGTGLGAGGVVSKVINWLARTLV